MVRFPEMFKEVLPVARKHQKEVVSIGFLLWTDRNCEKQTFKGREDKLLSLDFVLVGGELAVTELKGLILADRVLGMTPSIEISKSFRRRKENLTGHLIALALKESAVRRPLLKDMCS